MSKNISSAFNWLAFLSCLCSSFAGYPVVPFSDVCDLEIRSRERSSEWMVSHTKKFRLLLGMRAPVWLTEWLTPGSKKNVVSMDRLIFLVYRRPASTFSPVKRRTEYLCFFSWWCWSLYRVHPRDPIMSQKPHCRPQSLKLGHYSVVRRCIRHNI